MKPIENIYSMKLHDIGYIVGTNIQIARVPGGWIYSERLGQYEVSGHTFVRFDNEFMQ